MGKKDAKSDRVEKVTVRKNPGTKKRETLEAESTKISAMKYAMRTSMKVDSAPAMKYTTKPTKAQSVPAVKYVTKPMKAQSAPAMKYSMKSMELQNDSILKTETAMKSM